MARFFASQGLGPKSMGAANDSEAVLRHAPFMVIFGPSGQACQPYAPSGHNIVWDPTTRLLHAYENSFSHKPIIWYKNRLIASYRGQFISNEGYPYAWSPFGQSEGYKRNGAGYAPFNNAQLSLKVMLDGFNWVNWGHDLLGSRAYLSFINYGGKVLWLASMPNTALSWMQGMWDGSEPKYKPDGFSVSGYWPKPGQYGTPAAAANPTFGPFNCTNTPGNVQDQGGTKHSFSPTAASSPCDMIYHDGCVFVAGQYYLGAFVPGEKGNYIYHDLSADTGISSFLNYASYTARAVQAEYNTTSKCFVKHRGQLFMLSADGKFYRVTASRLYEQADLTTIGTPWGSGIVYGTCPLTGGSDTWNGTNGRRCFVASFNGQLHAFLNYTTSYQKAAGAGKGIMWATSHDGTNWSDRTNRLPSSGVIPSSGTSPDHIAGWYLETRPYRFSGKTGTAWRNNYTIWELLASGYNGGYNTVGWDCQPSGFRQTGPLPRWTGSGILQDVAGTKYSNLNIPLEHGAISGYLLPTWKVLPAGFAYNASGEFRPYGVGASGWDFTGCGHYHVAGYTDEDRQRLCLLFSEDFRGPAVDSNRRGKNLYYELTKSSGWILKNFLPHVNQLNGFVPIDLFEPEVIISSGTLYNPNPRINEVNQTVDISYQVFDWPYYGTCTVTGEYSTDGQVWSRFARKTGISSGSKATDPSGILGGPVQTLAWNYGSKLGKNTEFSNVQIRLRAEAT